LPRAPYAWFPFFQIASHCFSSTRRHAESWASVRSASVGSIPLSFSSVIISFSRAIRRAPLAIWSRIKCAVVSTIPHRITDGDVRAVVPTGRYIRNTFQAQGLPNQSGELWETHPQNASYGLPRTLDQSCCRGASGKASFRVRLTNQLALLDVLKPNRKAENESAIRFRCLAGRQPEHRRDPLGAELLLHESRPSGRISARSPRFITTALEPYRFKA